MNLENIFKDFDELLSNDDNESKKDFNDLVKSFISQYNMSIDEELREEDAKTSDDFLELAKIQNIKKNALKYAKKAFALDSNNLDAEVMIAELSAKSIDQLLNKLKKIIDKSTANLKTQGYFDDDCVGKFWLIPETRPYMRLLDKYSHLLTECAKMHLAIDECKKMLHLCENDNLGIRYRLMHLYAYLEDEQSALELYKKYEDEEGTQFLLPLSVLYYKLGNLTTATKYLKKLKVVNKDTYEFFCSVRNGQIDDYIDECDLFGYSPFTIEEFIEEMYSYNFLFKSTCTYFEWAYQKLKAMKD